MPMELRFDDLDLREEPPSLDGRAAGGLAPCSDRNTCNGLSKSLNACSDACCL